MTCRSRVLRTALTAFFSLLLVSGASAAPAGAAHPPRPKPQPHVFSLPYDALGDSYGSGYGVPPYSETCGRSTSSYASLLDGMGNRWLKLELDDFVACAGATTASLVDGGQLKALDWRTRFVTLSIGGNDIRWGDAVSSCLIGSDQQCAATQEVIRSLITDELPAKLDAVYSQVRRRAPLSYVVVTGYPHLFTPEGGDYFQASPEEQAQLNEGADLLNSVLRDAARRHWFSFVDVTKPFAGHGVNSAEPWVLGALDPGRFHPNAPGYVAYADAIAKSTKLRLR